MTSSSLLVGLLEDLAAERVELCEAVEAAGEQGWAAPTPAPGWAVSVQVAHLTWTDEVATLAARSHESPAAEQDWDAVVLAALASPSSFVDDAAIELAARPLGEVLDRWTRGQASLVRALVELPAGVRLPWFGPPMSGASMVTARFMETWAHGIDIHDALGGRPVPNDRIRHVAHLGVRTRNFAFAAHEVALGEQEFRVELNAPSGELWSWGSPDSEQQVSGSAYDFCLLVTQRIHRDDTDLVAVGADADRWLDLAQAFAGPPGAGRMTSRG